MYSKNTWLYNIKKDDWTPGPDMIKGRSFPACAMRGKDVIVIGGESSTKSSLEIWNGKDWLYSTYGAQHILPQAPHTSGAIIGATELKLISQGRNVYLFGGWENGKLSNTIWKINHKNDFPFLCL